MKKILVVALLLLSVSVIPQEEQTFKERLKERALENRDSFKSKEGAKFMKAYRNDREITREHLDNLIKPREMGRNKCITDFHLNMNNVKIRIRRASDDMQKTFDTSEEGYHKKLEAFCKGTDGHVSSISNQS
jgi:ribosome-associated translation inhibitor RaiA